MLPARPLLQPKSALFCRMILIRPALRLEKMRQKLLLSVRPHNCNSIGSTPVVSQIRMKVSVDPDATRFPS
jgi:hypothetical protein